MLSSQHLELAFPTWLAFALVSPAFWGIVHVLDSYCVDEVFDRPWVGTITSGIAMLIALPFLSVGLVFSETSPMSAGSVWLCVLSGFVFMASQITYFRALSFSESGIVAAYWNMLPLFLLIVSYVVWGERLTAAKYVGSGLLILSSISFGLLDGNIEYRWQPFWLMFTGAWLQVAYFLILKHVFAISPVYQAFLIITVSMIVAGLSPLLLTHFRSVFHANWPRIRPAISFLVAIEIANLIAVGTSQYAVNYGQPSLVSSVEAAIPAYTFVISLILYAVFRKYGEEEARHHLPLKLLLVAAMVFGVWLVS
jgi:uncharacterized membrane protein